MGPIRDLEGFCFRNTQILDWHRTGMAFKPPKAMHVKNSSPVSSPPLAVIIATVAIMPGNYALHGLRLCESILHKIQDACTQPPSSW